MNDKIPENIEVKILHFYYHEFHQIELGKNTWNFESGMKGIVKIFERSSNAVGTVFEIVLELCFFLENRSIWWRRSSLAEKSYCHLAKTLKTAQKFQMEKNKAKTLYFKKKL